MCNYIRKSVQCIFYIYDLRNTTGSEDKYEKPGTTLKLSFAVIIIKEPVPWPKFP